MLQYAEDAFRTFDGTFRVHVISSSVKFTASVVGISPFPLLPSVGDIHGKMEEQKVMVEQRAIEGKCWRAGALARWCSSHVQLLQHKLSRESISFQTRTSRPCASSVVRRPRLLAGPKRFRPRRSHPTGTSFVFGCVMERKTDLRS